MQAARDADSDRVRGLSRKQNHFPPSERRRRPGIFNSDANRDQALAGTTGGRGAPTHAGIPVSAVAAIAAILHKSEEAAPLLSLSAGHLCQSASARRRAS